MGQLVHDSVASSRDLSGRRLRGIKVIVVKGDDSGMLHRADGILRTKYEVVFMEGIFGFEKRLEKFNAFFAE